MTEVSIAFGGRRTKLFTFEELRDCSSLIRLMAVVNSVKQANDIWATAQNRIYLDLLVHTVPHIFISSLGLIQWQIFLYDCKFTVAHINCFIHNTLLSSTDLQVIA